MAVTLKEYVQNLLASGLMDADELRDFRAGLPPELSHLSAESLGHELIRRGKLTNYQAVRIYEGRPQGLILGNYVIVDQIGAGGMGDVYKAEHRRMKRPVVIKVLHPRNTEAEVALKRFQREVVTAGKLTHPNIVTAFDAGEEGGVPYLVMEYIEGRDLSSVARIEGPLAVERALEYTLQAAAGLAYAHARGIIHRDVKPSNLLVDNQGVVKVLDMGLARLDQRHGDALAELEEAVTEDNQIVGTVDYMPPEQADASGQIDERADIYSLGCTLYRLLSGQPPFPADSIIKKLVAHRIDPIPPLRACRSDVPESLDLTYQRMIAKLPGDRFASMTEVIAQLEKCRQELRARSGGSVRSGADQDATAGQTGEPPTDATQQMQVAEDTDHGGLEPPAGRRRREPAVGIDLGTTYSVLAWVDAEGRLQTLANAEGDKTTPSVVLFDGQEIVIGKEAVKAMATDMELVAECAKRELGRRYFHKSLGGADYPPEALQAWILNKLRLDVWKTGGRFARAVITVPAYFDEVRRKATQDAGYMAGFEVLDIINEPTAAALAFAQLHGWLGRSGEATDEKIVVYDLGGGTFDVSVLELRQNQFRTLATDGDVRLGGRDWDQRLVDFVADRCIREAAVDPRESPNTFGRLLRDCEEAKRALSARHRTIIPLDVQGASLRVPVTREQFQEMTQDLLERTIFTAQKTVRAAGLIWSDIDRVLLVGGSTRMPAVVARLAELAGRQPDCTVSPDEAVAHGAALHAAFLLDRQQGLEPGFEIHNVNSHSLGVAAVDPLTRRPQTAFVIPRNTSLPVTAKRTFNTSRRGQRSILLQIVEGESDTPNECVQIGRCTVRDLPPALPARTPVEVRFDYQANGRLGIRVRVAGTTTDLKHEIRRENSLDEEQLHAWRKRISGLPPTEECDKTLTALNVPSDPASG